MSEMKHTPGPWDVAPLRAVYEVTGAAGERLKAVGLPTEIEMASVGAYRVGQIAAIPMDESSMANAHLIAAAPDLLEALEVALLKMESDEETIDGEWGACRDISTMEAQDDLPGEILKARAAIAKAKGEP